MKLCKAIRNFFSQINANMRHKNIIEICSIYWNVIIWIFSDCLIFDGNFPDFIPLFLKNLHMLYQYCYQLLMLLFGRI